MSFDQIDFERLISNVGIPAVFMLTIAYVVAKYAPKVVTAHLEFLNAAKRQGEQCLKLQAQHAESLLAILALMRDQDHPRGDPKYRDHVFSTVRTNQALMRFADTLEELTRGSTHEAQIAPHLRAIREILRDRLTRHRAPERSTDTDVPPPRPK